MNQEIDKPYQAIKEKNISKVLSGRNYTYADLMTKHKKREHPLKGFEEHYKSLVDYILRCTYSIWEEKNIGLIYTHYLDSIEIYTPMGYENSAQSVVDDTKKFLSGFPDRQLYSINIIWSGNENEGYLSSHLNRSIMTNLGDSPFGTATGKKVDAYTIADCLCKENKIIKEWLVRDSGAYVRQLGLSLEEIAYDMAMKDIETKTKFWFEEETLQRTTNPKSIPKVKDSASTLEEKIVSDMFYNVWECNLFGMVNDYYSYNIQVWGLGGRNLCGIPNLKNFLSFLHSNFSNSSFKIEHIQSMDSDSGENEKLVHVRWSLCGKHATGGMFGIGTDIPLYMMGISHFRLIHSRIVEEWTVFDELSIWKQIKIVQIKESQEL